MENDYFLGVVTELLYYFSLFCWCGCGSVSNSLTSYTSFLNFFSLSLSFKDLYLFLKLLSLLEIVSFVGLFWGCLGSRVGRGMGDSVGSGGGYCCFLDVSYLCRKCSSRSYIFTVYGFYVYSFFMGWGLGLELYFLLLLISRNFAYIYSKVL